MEVCPEDKRTLASSTEEVADGPDGDGPDGGGERDLAASGPARDPYGLRRLPNHGHVTNYDICVLLISIFSHIFDVAFDINLAIRYYNKRETTYFILTVCFIMFPAVVNTFVSVRMYYQNPGDNDSSTKIAIKKWTIRLFVLLFQLAPIMRYCDSLDYALRCRRAEQRQDVAEQKKYYELMLKEDSDVALLRVFECFLEAAPQQILQMAIVLVGNNKGSTIQFIHQAGSIVSSMLSMAWSMASYHRSIRFIQADKSNLTWPASVVQFLWHFAITVSRILSISAIASQFPVWTGLACGLHWLLMTFWLALVEDTSFYKRSNTPNLRAQLFELIFCSILGLVYIFTYLTPSEGSTRNRYLIYYPICFLENLLAVVVWALLTAPQLAHKWYYSTIIITATLTFVIGILFMVLYYRYFHPETSKRSTVKEQIPGI